MFARFLAIASLLLAAGCGMGTETVTFDDEITAEGFDSLSTRSRTYVTLRRDVRRCMAPLCGGYYVRDVNRVAFSERYVSGLDFSLSGLSVEDQDAIRNAADGEVVLRGKLGSMEYQYRTRTFVVGEAYRGMPGVTPVAGELFYRAGPRSPTIYCFAAPCDNEVATKLNSTQTTYFTGYDVARAAKPHVDQDWLMSRVASHAAIVSAKFSAGQQMGAGAEKLLDASQVFVRLPERIGPCPRVAERLCPSGTVPTYTRTADRCLVQGECVTPGYCTMSMPVCAPDYGVVSWPAAPDGCKAFSCDPSFVTR